MHFAGMGDGGDEGRSSCEPDSDRCGTASGQGFPSNVPPTNGPLTEAQVLQAATVSALQHARVHPFYLQSSALNSQLAHLQQQALVQWGATASPYEIQSLLGSMFGSMQAVASAHQHGQQRQHQVVKPQPIPSMPGEQAMCLYVCVWYLCDTCAYLGVCTHPAIESMWHPSCY